MSLEDKNLQNDILKKEMKKYENFKFTNES
jgi:hypothetical protein